MPKQIKAFFTGIAGSFFFAFTFILNRSMNLSGGFWMYNAVLRYLFTLPILFLLLLREKRYLSVLQEIRKQPVSWLVWSTVGFGVFYTSVAAASLFSESWVTAALWQITIVCGVLLTPLFGKKVPVKNLLCSCLILVGIFVMQIPNLRAGTASGVWTALALILIGTFAYPLGNRKVMSLSGGLTTIQRVFGMVLCSMPFWLVCGGIAVAKAGLPTGSQCLQALGVAVFSGVVGTVLFFRATDMVRNNAGALAAVEATQCGEVIFTLLLGVAVLKDAAPAPEGWLGIGIIVAGMILTSVIKE